MTCAGHFKTLRIAKQPSECSFAFRACIGLVDPVPCVTGGSSIRPAVPLTLPFPSVRHDTRAVASAGGAEPFAPLSMPSPDKGDPAIQE